MLRKNPIREIRTVFFHDAENPADDCEDSEFEYREISQIKWQFWQFVRCRGPSRGTKLNFFPFKVFCG